MIDELVTARDNALKAYETASFATSRFHNRTDELDALWNAYVSTIKALDNAKKEMSL